jgi:ATP-dependent RNA helicase DDX3X
VAFDEADKMLEMGFEKAVREIVLQRDMPSREERQTVMFSATFPPKIEALAKDFLRPFFRIKVGRTGSSTKNIKQIIKLVMPFEKNECLRQELAASDSRTVVFVEKRGQCDGICDMLVRANFKAIAIHGHHEQWQREQALAQFKDGTSRVLVATSIAARGLDVAGVERVINYDMPKRIEDYTHRIGRTGRAGHKGVATTFFTQENRNIAYKLAEFLDSAKEETPPWLEQMSGFRPRPRHDERDDRWRPEERRDDRRGRDRDERRGDRRRSRSRSRDRRGYR